MGFQAFVSAIARRIKGSDGTILTIGAITDGQLLKRDGASVVSIAPSAASGEVRNSDEFTLSAGDITNGYVDLSETPADTDAVILQMNAAPAFQNGVAFTVAVKRVTWTGSALEGILLENDVIMAIYSYVAA